MTWLSPLAQTPSAPAIGPTILGNVRSSLAASPSRASLNMSLAFVYMPRDCSDSRTNSLKAEIKGLFRVWKVKGGLEGVDGSGMTPFPVSRPHLVRIRRRQIHLTSRAGGITHNRSGTQRMRRRYKSSILIPSQKSVKCVASSQKKKTLRSRSVPRSGNRGFVRSAPAGLVFGDLCITQHVGR